MPQPSNTRLPLRLLKHNDAQRKENKVEAKQNFALISEPRIHVPYNAPVELYLYTTVSFYKDHNALLTTAILEHIPLLRSRFWCSPHMASLG
jgi:hypothetical protein